VFPAEYKLRILAEFEAATSPGQRGALLRREGLYHSHLLEWAKARDAGLLGGAANESGGGQMGGSAPAGTPPRRRGSRPGASTEERERDALRRENERLARELARTKAALEIMGKAHALLELLSESAEPTRDSKPTT
jgi:hypothetical protein